MKKEPFAKRNPGRIRRNERLQAIARKRAWLAHASAADHTATVN